MRRTTITACLFAITPILAIGVLSAKAYAAPQSVDLKYMAAKVVVMPENRSDIDVKVKNNPKLPKITISQVGDKIVLNGQLKHKIDGGCGFNLKISMDGSTTDHSNLKVRGVGRIDHKDLPVIYIRTPKAVKLSTSSPVYGEVGPSDSLQLAVSGCGDWKAGPVAGKLELANSGSADINIVSAGAAEVATSGSGDVKLGNVKSLEISNSGSSDFSVVSVATTAEISNSGAGDLEIGTVGSSLTVSAAGSGDTDVKSVNGNVEISAAGSGDFHIHGGRAPKLSISIAGSGDVDFGGEAGAVDVSIAGSGDVNVRKATGPVSKHVMGSGDVHIGS